MLMKDFDLKEEIIKTIHHKDPFLPIIVTATSCSKMLYVSDW
jgi:hypothetical protein